MVMTIGAILGEAFADGVIFSIITKIWKILEGIFTKEIGEKAKEKIGKMIDSRSWEDEHFFVLDLAEANLNACQRRAINEGILRAEAYDRANGTRSARNFRIIVTINDMEEGVDPLNRPGKKILEHIAASCNDGREVFLAIQVVGAMHDPKFSFEKIVHIAKDHWFPFLKAKALGFHAATDANLTKFENAVDKRNKRPWLSKLFLN